MSLLNFSGVAFHYSCSDTLFENVTFSVDRADRIAIVGPNGSGKSTLLNLLAGSLEPTRGEIVRRKGVAIVVAGELLAAEGGESLFDFVFQAHPQAAELRRRTRFLEQRLATSEAATEYATTIADYQKANGPAIEASTLRALRALGFSSAEDGLPLCRLSGGQRTRASLARALLAEGDLLLLDEPTNHLDLSGREWLEQQLQLRQGACIVVSHDRVLLRSFSRCILDIERGKVRVFPGSYDSYRERRFLLERQAWAEYHAFERRKTAAEEAAVRRDRLAARVAKAPTGIRGGKDHYARKAAKVARTARILRERGTHWAQVRKPWEEQAIPPLLFDEVERSGDTALMVRELSKSYGSKCLFTGLDFQVQRGQRVAVRGPNGAGKSTLLRILAGQERADSGAVTFGAKVRLGWFAQDLEHLDPNQTALEICGAGTVARTLFACLRIRPERISHPARELSAGERTKIALVRLLLSGANVLLLDEPTNHLEVEAQEAFEQALATYPGSIVVASHDRAFLAALGDDLNSVVLGGA
jgi:ATP-binding cassette subfamily F protein 3